MAGKSTRDALLGHYQRELGYLRRMGNAFAETYPKIAGRLEFGGSESADPHVERLIESFAFLTGRIQQNIDANFHRSLRPCWAFCIRNLLIRSLP